MTENERNYYVKGNTAKGFYSFIEPLLENLKQVYILKGKPASTKSLLIKKIDDKIPNRGTNVDVIHNPSDNKLVDGIVMPSVNFGVISVNNTEEDQLRKIDNIKETLNVDSILNLNVLLKDEEKINRLNKDISDNYQKAYNIFNEALKIHDEWEKIYINNMDFDEANKISQELTKVIFKDNFLKKDSKRTDMFFGAATPSGPVDFIENLTRNMSKRYFIKGRPGTGKSTMLKKLASESQNRGIDVEVYHCGFDPNSLDMLIFPELNITIFDSTAPHEYFPSRQDDEIVDMYARAVKPGTDEKYSEKLKNITSRYSEKMKEATSYLSKAKKLNDELDNIYTSSIDPKKLEELENKLLNDITNIL